LAGSIAARSGRTEDAIGIAAQRTERPQELRALIATLRRIESVPQSPGVDRDGFGWAIAEGILDGIVRELGVRA
jgi:hypothetical protein